jgi:hypothetical protein
VIKLHLNPGEITNPPVVRTISCPSSMTFMALHQAIQTAFDWATTHSFDSAVKDPDFDHAAGGGEPPDGYDQTIDEHGRQAHRYHGE